MLALNCSCLLYTFLTWLLWVSGFLSQLPPSPHPHCYIATFALAGTSTSRCIDIPCICDTFTLSISIFSCYFMFDVDIPPEFSTGSKYVWSWLWCGMYCQKINIFGYILLVFLVHVVKIFSVTSKVYNKLRYQTDNWSGDGKTLLQCFFLTIILPSWWLP